MALFGVDGGVLKHLVLVVLRPQATILLAERLHAHRRIGVCLLTSVRPAKITLDGKRPGAYQLLGQRDLLELQPVEAIRTADSSGSGQKGGAFHDSECEGTRNSEMG